MTDPDPGGDGGLPDIDVVAIGSPLVDVLAAATDEEIAAAGLVRGSMELVDLDRAEQIYAAMGSTASRRPAARPPTPWPAWPPWAAPPASSARSPTTRWDGCSSTTSGRPGSSSTPVVGRAPASATWTLGTGRCLVLVSGDAERTMATHLGAATTIGPDDVPDGLVARGRIVYLEGYLWDLPPAKEAMRQAVGVAHRHDGSVALSLSDPFCVERHQREFLDLLLDDVDVLFGNEEEITAAVRCRRRSTRRSKRRRRPACWWPSPWERPVRWC